MSQKRKHIETIGGAGDLPKFKKQRYHHQGHKHGKRGKPRTDVNEPKPDSINSLKSRIRNLKRLLGHIDNDPKNKMSANSRLERERELEACEHELAEKQAVEREADFRNKIIGKYHHIRFFERQKATRTVKRLTKQLSATEDESEKAVLRRRLHNADVDVNYTIYYPLLRPYVSLFPNSKKDSRTPTGQPEQKAVTNKQNAEAVDGPKGSLEMWEAVEKAMEKGTLEALRNSKEGIPVPGPRDPILESSKGRKTKQDYKREAKQKAGKATAPAEDEDSDGGFFDE